MKIPKCTMSVSGKHKWIKPTCTGLLLFIIGIVMLWIVDWKIAIGVFLVLWANNIADEIKEKK